MPTSCAPNGRCRCRAAIACCWPKAALRLDLWFGDVNELLPQFDASMNNQVDAWFLDGFAPAKNPDMWTEQLFAAMARFARPEGSFATFTAAGFVRRGFAAGRFSGQPLQRLWPKT